MWKSVAAYDNRSVLLADLSATSAVAGTPVAAVIYNSDQRRNPKRQGHVRKNWNRSANQNPARSRTTTRAWWVIVQVHAPSRGCHGWLKTWLILFTQILIKFRVQTIPIRVRYLQRFLSAPWTIKVAQCQLLSNLLFQTLIAIKQRSQIRAHDSENTAIVWD